MGNSLPLPCVRHHDADEAEGTAGGGGAKKRWKKQKSRPACRKSVVRAAARLRHVVPVVDTPPEDGGDGGEVVFKEAWRRPGCRVEPAGDRGEDGGGVRRVKIVMRRKDIAELVARLEQRDAAERNATVMEAAELSTGLGGYGGGNGCGGGATMSPCRDAWRPRLSIIPENY